ncbi:uncharacterized protein LOC127748363 [Arachis duranensis]|uniref:Uncharacterized protein LOC127748363 n=1 Tax=Arachis duranensis TaxID=130453 RepID=A0A9C6TQM3_ARADU|nr:uncharacterized protein LOC127748363 [Arachis duranensis]
MSLSSFRSFVPIWHHRAPNHQSLGLFDVTQRMRLPPPLKCSAAEPDQETKVPATCLLLNVLQLFDGVPLPLVGMVAYGLVAALGLQLATNKMLPFGIGRSRSQLMMFHSF